MLKHARKGDRVYCSSMYRMARNLDDLLAIVLGLTRRGVEVEFVNEGLTSTGEDNAMAKLPLSMMGAFAEFERSLILERQSEGIALAKKWECTRAANLRSLRSVRTSSEGELEPGRRGRLLPENSE
jgi:DNA invertase Pin-like site-specific DNA recombinase